MSRRPAILLGTVVSALATLLMVAWAFPIATTEQFPLRDARVVEGNRLDYQLPQRELGWFSSLLWRSPDHDVDGPVVWMSCGDAEWGGKRASNTELKESTGKVRLRIGGALYFSLPDQAKGEVVSVRLINPPRGWVGPACSILALVGITVLLVVTPPRRRWIWTVAVCLLGTCLYGRQLTSDPVGDDALQNFVMASNLVTHGVYSLNVRQPTRPSMEREPVPIFTSAAAIAIARWILGNDPMPGAQQTQDLVAAKSTNLIWVFGGLLATWWLACVVTKSHVVGLFSTYLAWLLLFTVPYYANSLLTEPPAAALIAAASSAFILTVDRRDWKWAAMLGAFVGLLCLTKAAFLYISAGVIAFVLAYVVLRATLGYRSDGVKALKLMAVAGCALLVVCVPWMARNKIQCDRWAIALRGGSVLMVRATKNTMTHEEWKASWWLWGPEVYRDLVAGTSLGCMTTDFDLGGPYERLSRATSNNAVSYFHAAKVERATAVAQARQSGDRNSAEIADRAGEIADRAVQRKATSMILADPIAHLKCMLPFTWRGIWCLSSPSPHFPQADRLSQKRALEVISALLWLCLAATALVATCRRFGGLLAAIALPALMLAMHALLTHNIPRYSVPAVPVMCVCFAATVSVCSARIRLHWPTRTSVQPIRKVDQH